MSTPEQLQAEIAVLKKTLWALIIWMAGSAGAPMSVAEARALLDVLEDK